MKGLPERLGEVREKAATMTQVGSVCSLLKSKYAGPQFYFAQEDIEKASRNLHNSLYGDQGSL